MMRQPMEAWTCMKRAMRWVGARAMASIQRLTGTVTEDIESLAPVSDDGVLRVQHTGFPETGPEWPYPYRFMWFYRTELRNDGPNPLQITRFEAYSFQRGKWLPGNILGRRLTATDFTDWYSDGDPVADGWIAPKSAAVDAGTGMAIKAGMM